MQAVSTINTGSTQVEQLEPVKTAANSGAPTAAKLSRASSRSQPASAGDITEVRSDKHNQLVVINGVLSRIAEWFGKVQVKKVTFNAGTRIVIILPQDLDYCQHCNRVRLFEDMLPDGLTCIQCEKS